MFFFQFPSKVDVLIFLFTFLQFYSVVSWDSKVHTFSNSLFLLIIIIRFGLLAEIRWSVCVTKSLRSLSALFSRIDPGLCMYHFFVWLNLNFLLIFLVHPFVSSLTFLLPHILPHSLIMWLMFSSLSPHNIYFLFCCILSILTYGVVLCYY